MPESTTGLTCPKCAGGMRNYERNGVHIDQCSDCRGIFLDRGELDRLIDAEAAFNESAPQQSGPPPVYAQRQQEQPYQQQPHYGDKYRDDRHHGGHKKKRRGSFFEELFD